MEGQGPTSSSVQPAKLGTRVCNQMIKKNPWPLNYLAKIHLSSATHFDSKEKQPVAVKIDARHVQNVNKCICFAGSLLEWEKECLRNVGQIVGICLQAFSFINSSSKRSSVVFSRSWFTLLHNSGLVLTQRIRRNKTDSNAFLIIQVK